jgi:Fe-S oxidoreductase
MRDGTSEAGHAEGVHLSSTLPCPEGVRPIEALFYALGLAQKLGVENLRPSIRKTVASLGLEKCTYCGRCEEMCPSRMPIRAAIREARALFGV